MEWNPLRTPVDYVLIKQRASPGLCDILDAKDIRIWDKIKGPGLSGAYLRFLGKDLSEFTIRLRLYTEEDWKDWWGWFPILEAPKGKAPKALDIWHPWLEMLDIRSIEVLSIGVPITDDNMVSAIDIKVSQFRMPKVQYAKPEASAATPVDPVDQTIERKRKQVQELADS